MAWERIVEISLGPDMEGLTLYGQLKDKDGVDSGSPISTGFHELANGDYFLYHNAFPDGFLGVLAIYDDADDSYLGFVAINYADSLAEFKVESKVVDASAAAGQFKGATALSSTDDFYNGSYLVFLSGTMRGLARKVSDYIGSTRTFRFLGQPGEADEAFPAAPANGDFFDLIGRSA